MNKLIVISLSIAVLLIGGAIAYTSNNISPSSNNPKAEEIKIIGGKQIIEISAKGGYFPRKTIAKAGVPTILRIKTNGTFDCSSSLFIPKLNYHKSLTPSGVENIEIPASEANGVLRGLCSMGMYNFEVDFE